VRVIEAPAELESPRSGTVGLVPTMGSLHEGHLSLVEEARRRADQVVMSLFVNPLQFDRPEDLLRYPRDPERDAAVAEEAGVDILFAPPVETMYPETPLTRVEVAEVTSAMEGVARPGHFGGVALVVAKLFAALRPDLAFFGRKDHQQLAVVRRLALDLSFPVEVVGCPVVRDPDGLALSSRNVFIQDRARAASIARGLLVAAQMVDEGERTASRLVAAVTDELELDTVDYVELASQARAQPMATLERPAFLAVAGRLGDIRLIDNLPIDLVGEMWVPDRGILLEQPSNQGGP
jgi:pantoate--beta-alanine ligase